MVTMGAGGDEDENGNPPVPETSPDSIRSLAKYASRKAEAEAEVEAEDKFRNMRVGGGLTEEPSDDEVRHVNYDTVLVIQVRVWVLDARG